jgi:altronate hydrolase
MPEAGKAKFIILHSGDDVGVALEQLDAGAPVTHGERTIELQESIPPGHKFALNDLKEGRAVYKYGERIGVASEQISTGAHVHGHNLELGSLERSHDVTPRVSAIEHYEEDAVPTFEGYLRPDGTVGTRNHILVISTVNCSASAARRIAENFDRGVLADYPEIDGVSALTHKSGCGMQLAGEDHEQLQRTLAGFAQNPNVAGSIIVGLGCEVNQARAMLENTELLDEGRPNGGVPEVLNIQELGGFQRTVEEGIEAVAQLLPGANAVERTPQPASELVLGLQCGGSDAYSGIAANPAVGAAVDELVRSGGTAILGETTEVYGAEHLLTKRASTEAIARRLLEHIQWWERYTRVLGAEIDNNPTPGNKAGGLTTIYEKSLGAIAKGGTMPLAGIYNYAEEVAARGLVFMDTPGYDAASITGMVAGGANLVVFTTGRGSVYGCKPVPTLKVASNSALFQQLEDDMDIDAGPILHGTSLQELGQHIFAELLEAASGKPTKSEQHGIGEEEFCPWLLGPVL